MDTITLTKNDGTKITVQKERPKYGGTYTQCLETEPTIFDDAFGVGNSNPCAHLQYDDLIQGDWTRGPQGTGEASYSVYLYPRTTKTGCIAESWEIVSPEHFIFHIRQGVHFQDRPLVNGREVTAYDVEYSMNRLFTEPKSTLAVSYPLKTNFESMKATDKWTFDVVTKPGLANRFEQVSNFAYIHPHEIVEKYGDMRDWRNQCGTGAFILMDYVPGSSLLYTRNPNYWQKDPFQPKNQLPYIDEVKMLIIPDASTRLAAMRSYRLDFFGTHSSSAAGVDPNTRDDLLRTNPELKSISFPSTNQYNPHLRMDKPSSPLSNKLVRQAISMAIDRKSMIKNLFNGNGSFLIWPVANIPEYSGAFVPFDQLPKTVQEILEYHPDKARQLLTQAGYPKGFTTSIVYNAIYGDTMSLFKAYLADIGITLELQPKDASSMTTIQNSKAYDNMTLAVTSGGTAFSMTYTMVGNNYNFSLINDPFINEIQAKIFNAYWDDAERNKLMRQYIPYVLEQCPIITMPAADKCVLWYPWLKGYKGEQFIEQSGMPMHARYAWIDRELKEKITGRK